MGTLDITRNLPTTLFVKSYTFANLHNLLGFSIIIENLTKFIIED